MDGANKCAPSTDYEDDEEDSRTSGGVRVTHKASAVVAFEREVPSQLPLPAPFSVSQSISPHARPITPKAVKAKRGSSGSSSTGNSEGGSPLALTIVPAATAPVKTIKSSPQPPPPIKRIRKRKLSAKQMKRWLEKEEEDSQIYNLTLDVNELKQQLQYFELQKSLHATRMLVARQNFTGGAMRTVNMFFKMFQRGLREWSPDEYRFIQSSLDEQVGLGTAAFGRQLLIEQWARYTTLFQIRSFVNLSVNLLSSDPACTIVQCIGQFEGWLSRQAIEAVFPHILHDEELVKRVLESKFLCPATTLLYFDVSGTIVRYDAHADIFEGLNLLFAANPRDAITMMANARIGDASMIPSDREDDDIVSISSSLPPREERFAVVEKENAESDRHSVEFLLS